MTEILLPLLTTILGIDGTLGAIWLKSHLSQKNKLKSIGAVEASIAEDIEITKVLDAVLKELNADRVAIYSFHNGGQFYSGKSMQKMSVSYESVGVGISSNQMQKQNIPLSACLKTICPIIRYKEFHIPDVDSDYPPGLCKLYLQEEGTQSVYYWALVDLNNNIIGYLRVDFVKSCIVLSEQKLKAVLLRAIKLPGYLGSKK